MALVAPEFAEEQFALCDFGRRILLASFRQGWRKRQGEKIGDEGLLVQMRGPPVLAFTVEQGGG